MKRAIGMLAALGLLLASFGYAPEADAQDDVTITILHNNDGESNLLPDDEGADPGIARFVALMKQLQADAPGDGVVTLTSGDNFLASKEFSASLTRGTPFYDSIALSGLYDTMALGNHDFDFGPDVTADFVSGFDPAIPFLSANADFSGEPVLQALVDQGRIAASTVIETGGTQVGVIGAITPRLPNISSPRNVVISADIAAAINAEAAALEAAGVNKIILISHLQGLAQDQDLVPQLVGIDIVIAGGGDELLKNASDTCLPDEEAASPYPLLISGIPVVTGPGGYRCIGQLNVTFDSDGNVATASGANIGVPSDIEPDAGVQADVVEPLTAALADLTANVIATSEVDLDGLRSSVRTMSSNEGSLLADAILDAGKTRAPSFSAPVPQVAFQNGGGIRNDAVIPAGDITEADTFDVAPFGNFVVTMEVPREVFYEVIENAYSGLPEAEGRFAQIAGFTVTVDPNLAGRELDHEGDCVLIGDPGSRVVDITLDDGTQIVADGQLVPGDPVVVATIDFLANGGDCYPLGGIDFTRVGSSYQQALADYITGPLEGSITESRYSAADGRVTILPTTDVPEPDASGDDGDGGEGGEGGDEGDEGDEGEDLPATGSTTAPMVLVGLGIAAAGAVVVFETRRFNS